MDDLPLIDRSKYPDLAYLLDYCRGLSAGAALPRAEDFRPTDVRRAVGWINLIDVIDGGADFRIRLFGTVWQSVYGIDITGQLLSSMERYGHFNGVRDDYLKAVKTRQPVFHLGKVVWSNGSELSFGRLLVPFVGDGGQVCRLLLAADCGMSAEDVIMLRGHGLPQLALDGSTEDHVALSTAV
jgi:hypothetical protein